MAVITGLMGSGKTWLLSRLFNQLPPELLHQHWSGRGLHTQPPPQSRQHVRRLLGAFLPRPNPAASRPSLPASWSRAFRFGRSYPSLSFLFPPSHFSAELFHYMDHPSSHPSSTEHQRYTRGLPSISPFTCPQELHNMQSMVRLVKTAKSSSDVMEMLELVHMIDTGGQPELLESVPSLIHHCHLAITGPESHVWPRRATPPLTTTRRERHTRDCYPPSTPTGRLCRSWRPRCKPRDSPSQRASVSDCW